MIFAWIQTQANWLLFDLSATFNISNWKSTIGQIRKCDWSHGNVKYRYMACVYLQHTCHISVFHISHTIWRLYMCPVSFLWDLVHFIIIHGKYLIHCHQWLMTQMTACMTIQQRKKTPILLSAAPAVSTLVFDTYLGIVWISAKYTKNKKTKKTTQNLLTWVNNNESAISISPPFTRNHRCILV